MKNKITRLRVFFYIAIFLIALLLAVTSTFSWYNRTEQSNNKSFNLLEYKQTGNVNNGSSITVETFEGINDNGVISYSEAALSDNTDIKVQSDKLSYFKTVITDNSNSGDSGNSLVSLYYTQLVCSSNLENKFHIGIIGPEKTYNQFSGTSSEGNYVVNYLLIEDNLLVINQGKIELYWFIQVDESYTGEGTITLGTPYVVNN